MTNNPTMESRRGQRVISLSSLLAVVVAIAATFVPNVSLHFFHIQWSR